MDDRILLHQVHPLKLAANISASLISIRAALPTWGRLFALLWQHRPVAGLVTRYALPIAGSAIVLSLADVDRLRDTAAGRYVLANMSPGAMAVRLAGGVVMAVGSWYRRPPLIALGLLIVAAGGRRGWLATRGKSRDPDVWLGRRPQDGFLARQVSLRIECGRGVQPGESDLEGVLPLETAAFGMEEMAEEEIEGTALIARGDLELAGRLVADQPRNGRSKRRLRKRRLR